MVELPWHLETITLLSKSIRLETFLLLLLTSKRVALVEVTHRALHSSVWLHRVRLHWILLLHAETLIAHLEALHLP